MRISLHAQLKLIKHNSNPHLNLLASAVASISGRSRTVNLKFSAQREVVRRVALAGQAALTNICFRWQAPSSQQSYSGIP